MDISYSFTKEERLKSEADITMVYTNGKKAFHYPFKIYYYLHEEKVKLPLEQATEPILRICISAPKRKLKKAVDRNLIKRRTREAFRLNKHLWYEKAERIKSDLYLIFIGNELTEYNVIEKAIIKTLNGIELI